MNHKAEIQRDIMRAEASGDIVGYSLTVIVEGNDGIEYFQRYASAEKRLTLIGAEIEGLVLSIARGLPKELIDP